MITAACIVCGVVALLVGAPFAAAALFGLGLVNEMAARRWQQ